MAQVQASNGDFVGIAGGGRSEAEKRGYLDRIGQDADAGSLGVRTREERERCASVNDRGVEQASVDPDVGCQWPVVGG